MNFTILIVFVVSLILLLVVWRLRKMPQWEDLPLNSEAKDWRDYLIAKRETYFKSSRLWKVIYRSLLIFTTFFGSTAAILPHLESFIPIQEEGLIGLASISAAVSALFASMLGVLSCEEYYLLNQRHRYEVEDLLLKVADTPPDIDEIVQQMVRILNERGSRE